ncbi:unnamed protein product, partial [Callosobruchus maculatus]
YYCCIPIQALCACCAEKRSESSTGVAAALHSHAHFRFVRTHRLQWVKRAVVDAIDV